jgi:hypothetical protein
MGARRIERRGIRKRQGVGRVESTDLNLGNGYKKARAYWHLL